jgi:hypothetical protein
VIWQLILENSKKAQESQVTVILSYGLKKVMTLLVLSSFTKHLLRKVDITLPKLESSKYWDTTIVMLIMMVGNSEFIITS